MPTHHPLTPSFRRGPRVPSFALAVLLGVSGCASSSGNEGGGSAGDLEMKLRRIEVKGGNFEQVELLVIVAAANQGSKPVKLEGGSITLAFVGPGKETPDDVDVDVDGIVDGQKYAGKPPSGEIAGGAEAELAIPVTLPLPADTAAFERLLAWRVAELEVQGTLETSAGPLVLSGKREVAMPLLPKIVLTSSQIASVDEGVEGVAFFELGIDNPNAFDISVDRFNYSIQIGTKEMHAMGEGSREDVPPASVSSFEENINISETTYGPEVKKLLKQPAIPYHVEAFYVVRGIERKAVFDGEMAFAR
jgi:LEA14-like dessication related protein